MAKQLPGQKLKRSYFIDLHGSHEQATRERGHEST